MAVVFRYALVVIGVVLRVKRNERAMTGAPRGKKEPVRLTTMQTHWAGEPGPERSLVDLYSTASLPRATSQGKHKDVGPTGGPASGDRANNRTNSPLHLFERHQAAAAPGRRLQSMCNTCPSAREAHILLLVRGGP